MCGGFMAFKKKTELINVSGSISEVGPNTFTELEVSLDLDPLSREIFVVTDAYLDPFTPNTVPGLRTSTKLSVTNTSRTGVQTIADSQCISNVTDTIFGGAAEFNFARTAMPVSQISVGTSMDYLSIISTPNFFVQVQGENNLGGSGGSFRLTGYRAVADADTYSALVASEVLSV